MRYNYSENLNVDTILAYKMPNFAPLERELLFDIHAKILMDEATIGHKSNIEMLSGKEQSFIVDVSFDDFKMEKDEVMDGLRSILESNMVIVHTITPDTDQSDILAHCLIPIFSSLYFYRNIKRSGIRAEQVRILVDPLYWHIIESDSNFSSRLFADLIKESKFDELFEQGGLGRLAFHL